MSLRVVAVALGLLVTVPALADPVPGADDPAFRVPFARALNGDDPTALVDLHAAAEAGNMAALLVLPAVSDWLRGTLPFAERKRMARVGGVPLAEAVEAADPVAALWAGGAVGDDWTLLDRAMGLARAGEIEKGAMLFQTWMNQTGAGGALPEGLFDTALPDMVLAQVLSLRTASSGDVFDAATVALFARRLAAGDRAAIMALALLTGVHRPESPPTFGPLDVAAVAGMARTDLRTVQAAIDGVAPAVRLAFAFGEHEMDPETARAGAALLAGEEAIAPLRAMCAAACPETATGCVAAFIWTLGPPYGRIAPMQPPTSVIAPEEFLATPRGLGSLARAVGSIGPERSNLAIARQIDACLVDHLGIAGN